MIPRFDISGIIGEGQACAEPLRSFLAENAGTVEVFVNSPGGIATEGAAMLAELERHGEVTVHIVGMAASAASLAAMGGKRILMHSAALFMIHDPSGFTFGPADQHRAAADTLDKMSDTYARAYARATGHSVDRIKAWMKAETWLTADEALELNLCDEIEGTETAEPVFAAFDYSRFFNPPNELIRLAQKNGWARGASEASNKGKANS
jgi:ATP-dependent protease ClpP protease subunit